LFTITGDERHPGPHPGLVFILCALYLLAGVIGHDPWKSEDALHLGVIHGFVAGNDWRLPSIAGEPWPQVEPLYYWVGAVFARALQPLLAFHDAARLASAAFGALFLFGLSRAARTLYGSEAGWGAPLLAIGTVGLLVPIHDAQPATAMLAAAACAYWGATLLAESPLAAGLLLGSGVGAGFLAGGLSASAPLVPLLLAPLFFRRWGAFVIALAIAAAVGTVWPMLLIRQAPAFFDAWWAAELTSIAPARGFTITHIQWLGWFVWPVQFVALWMMWHGRRHLFEAQVALPLTGALAALAWFLCHEAKPVTALSMLPPLVLLASAGTERLKRGAANAWDWFGMMTFTIVASLVWLGSVAMLTGWPPKIAYNFAKLEPGFVATFSPVAIVLASAVTALWFAVLLRLPRSPWRVATRWAAGLTVMWALLACLWMPWIDYGKTYRPVIASLRLALPKDAGCVARRGLGLPQRAMLDYFGSIRTRWQIGECQWLITQDNPDEASLAGWHQVWEGHRPGDRNERLRLYRKQGS
jgi:4-amino-4-deoxy-L-arabinose transferase-like glycosyltransferase